LNNRFLLFIFFGFVLLTFIFTFPLFLKFGTHVSGTVHTSELFFTIWAGWQERFAFLNHIDLNNYHFISYPFSTIVSSVVVFPVGYSIIKWFSILTNEIIMYNLIITLSFVLSGLFAFILARYLTKNLWAAFFTGLIFAFCPYHFSKSCQYLGLSEIQWLPLYIYSLIRLKDEPGIKGMVLLSAVLFMFSENYFHVYLVLIATLLFVIVSLLQKDYSRKVSFVKFLILAAVVVFLLTLPTTYGIYRAYLFSPSRADSLLFYRPFQDLFSQSARPLSYFLPSITNPLLGGITGMFLGSNLYGINFSEHTLYLGWTAIIISLFVLLKLKRRQANIAEHFYIRYFAWLAVTAWFFSQPPWWNWFGLRIFMPSFFMYKILPMFRVYARFGVLVMLAVSVLAGFGLKFILGYFKSKKIRFLIFTVCCGLIMLEFWNYPPFRIIDISQPPEVYVWLKQQPSDIVIAEYPLYLKDARVEDWLYQTKHHKRIINGAHPGSYAYKVAKSIEKLSALNSARTLKWLGVKYVIVHRGYYQQTGLVDQIDELQMIAKNPGLKLIKVFPAQECPANVLCIKKTGPIDVYEVQGPPVEPHLSSS